MNALHSRYEQPTTTIDALEKQYPQLFNGIGKLNNVEDNLHIDETVRSLTQPPYTSTVLPPEESRRRAPVASRQNIIERAGGDEPTPWMSPVVTPLKPKGPTKVRIGVDMRKAPTAILRTRHAMSTVEDVVTAITGAKVMSKLDLSHAYQ